MDNEKHFSKIVGTENGEEARFHCWRDESGIHFTLDCTNANAMEALDCALSTKCMSEEEYEKALDLINEIIYGS